MATKPTAKNLPAKANKVIYDQDGLGERDHNLYGLLVLLQAPGVELVGLTTVSGREWSPRQTPRALEILHRLGRGQVPVAPGAVFPLINSPARTARWEQVHGPLFDAMCHDLDPDNPPSDLDPFWLPPPAASEVGTDRRAVRSLDSDSRPDRVASALEEPAAMFMVRMARQYPGEISIVATGPLTNLALAIRLDPAFPSLVKQLIFVGGRFMPYSRTGHFTRTPSRREVNFRHDPEAAHIVLHAEWGRGGGDGIVCLPRDLTDPIRITREMHEKIARARTPIGRLLKSVGFELFSKGDAIAAAIFADPSLIADSDAVCMDIDLSPGANHGCLLNWRDEEFAPKPHPKPIRVVIAIHEKPFADHFVTCCTTRRRAQASSKRVLAKAAKGTK